MSTSQKNYEAAFASLQSSFGFSGTAPCVPTSLPKSKSSTTAWSRDTSPPSRSTSTSSKNYEAAFGRLQTAYAFGGASFSGSYKR
ncbi:hypothetical protein M422DRAFT_24974 [Sphaerobolus stellatus SS14]|nr:hypothetical protein M422DRAFT_24974 [Sphaerobolus stellatus SS14]